LLVGPESAGADPGPVCYGNGGTRPTVTDANLVLGRLRPDAFLGGRMALDAAAARGALAGLGRALGLAGADIAEQAALGVVELANEHMARALRVISVQRGLDPRNYTLCSFGGAGGLHVCALAEALGMDQALVPARAGVLSALGMLVSPPGRLLTRTWLGLLAERDDAEVTAALDALAAEGIAALAAEGHASDSLRREPSLDLRYRGQSYTLNLPWQGIAATAAAFGALHQARYGHTLELPVELVNLRLRLTAPAADVALDAAAADQLNAGGPPGSEETVFGCGRPARVLPRLSLAAGVMLDGPAVILDEVATTWLAPAWQARRDMADNLRLSRQPAG
jgi:N-methylhydantoinase A